MIIDTNAAIEGLKSNCKLKSGLINQTENFFQDETYRVIVTFLKLGILFIQFIQATIWGAN